MSPSVRRVGRMVGRSVIIIYTKKMYTPSPPLLIGQTTTAFNYVSLK